MNPYRNLPDSRFWSRAVSYPQHGQIDPVSRGHVIGKDDKVATMGSCFAQHLARQIRASGLNYFVPEAAPADMAREDAIADNYETFSARYGNVYTVRQALQLFDRAFGFFEPREAVWPFRGGFVDPFRPRIDRVAASSSDAVLMSRDAHLIQARRVFEEADWLVFTLGLTEAWRSREDGAVYPLAPGVAGGAFEPSRHEFVNFTVREVMEDLEGLYRRVTGVNRHVRFLLTVSPVPLVATYEPRHVLQSTTVSKAILRVAADELERAHDDVIYFPSYEIITSPAAGGRYYEDDLREVTRTGVSHVMRVFRRHFIAGEDVGRSAVTVATNLSLSTLNEIVCDEEVIESALRQAGLR